MYVVCIKNVDGLTLSQKFSRAHFISSSQHADGLSKYINIQLWRAFSYDCV